MGAGFGGHRRPGHHPAATPGPNDAEPYAAHRLWLRGRRRWWRRGWWRRRRWWWWWWWWWRRWWRGWRRRRPAHHNLRGHHGMDGAVVREGPGGREGVTEARVLTERPGVERRPRVGGRRVSDAVLVRPANRGVRRYGHHRWREGEPTDRDGRVADLAAALRLGRLTERHRERGGERTGDRKGRDSLHHPVLRRGCDAGFS